MNPVYSVANKTVTYVIEANDVNLAVLVEEVLNRGCNLEDSWVEYAYDGDVYDVSVFCRRPMTNEEIAKEKAREREQRSRGKKRIEERERKEYERLRAKFGES